MKIAFLQIFLSVLCLSAQAQKVTNIHAEQRGQDIVVLFSLETTSPCEVSLLLSQDNGVTWGSPLKNVSGDVGKNIASGEKQINWKVLEEREQLVGDKIKFKVIANCNKSFEPEMIFVEGGTFQMGSSSGESDEEPIHTVTLSSFNIGKYEVTQSQWKSVMGNNPSLFSGCDDCPVETVSWNDVQEYIKKLNSRTGKDYRLPSEAEWEYAAKGGKSSNGFTYSGSNDLNTVAWNMGNSGNKTHSVGGKQANELGIYDMSGNIWEWCADWYGAYSSDNVTNPTGSSSAENRVLRGGSWRGSAGISRTASRYSFIPNSRINGYYGFRLVLPTEDVTNAENIIQPIKSRTPPEENESELVETFVEDPAEFPGGKTALYKFISNNLIYPEDAIENGIEGKVIVKFVVDVDGTVRDAIIERGIAGGQSLEQAAIDVCKKLPKFNPAFQSGKPIKTYFMLPIVFDLGD